MVGKIYGWKKIEEIVKGHRKGQAVMEYLITYGLALFVILIVLAILVAVVLPTLKAPESCQFTQPGFGCSSKQHALVADGSNNIRVLLVLDNEQGRAITLSGILCSNEPPGNIRKLDVPALPGGNISMAAGASQNFTTNCLTQGVTPVVLSSGSSFKGSVAVTYNFQDEVAGAPARLAVATLSGTVQSQ